MTIAAVYLTSEGVVFGADSTTTVSVPAASGGSGVVQLFNHAQKIFEVGKPGAGRIGVCTWGLGSLGQVSHRTAIARMADKLGENSTVEEATTRLNEIVDPLVKDLAAEHLVGYFVGGIDPETHNPACYQLALHPKKSTEVEQIPVGQARFSGAPEVFTRVFRGFDAKLPSKLLQALKARMSDLPTEFDKHFGQAFEQATAGLLSAGMMDIPIREAIDYVHTYVRMTIKAFKFRFGPPLCGGPVELAFISTDRPFRWVRHKRFGTAIREQDATHG